MTSTGFYRAFEERHRGPRDLIKQRLEAYLPFIAPLLQLYEPAAALDLGCGRGEWLELLQEKGFLPLGVDLDEGMLEACKERGLPATQGDAIAYLKSLADATQCIVSGFHIVEHIAFDDLQTLVIEALRVLKPGGLLILETPNPENIVVGTSNFYLDPTHLRPIPPLLLTFLPEYYGFERVKTLRLQESPELAAKENIGLYEVFAGVSPDYAIVAQKNASPEVLCAFDAAFAKHHGIELNELANRYDAGLERGISILGQRMANIESQAGGMSDALARITVLQDRLIDAVLQAERNAARAQAAEGKADAAESRAAEAESRAAEAESRATEAESRATESHAQEQKLRIDQLGGCPHHGLQACALETERNALRQSWSWRITAPLRWGGGILIKGVSGGRQGATHFVHSSINAFQHPLATMMRVVLRNPSLSYRINQRLLRYPALHEKLLGAARRGGVIPGKQPNVAPAATAEVRDTPALSSLTPRAREIYNDLKAGIEKRQEEQG